LRFPATGITSEARPRLFDPGCCARGSARNVRQSLEQLDPLNPRAQPYCAPRNTQHVKLRAWGFGHAPEEAPLVVCYRRPQPPEHVLDSKPRRPHPGRTPAPAQQPAPRGWLHSCAWRPPNNSTARAPVSATDNDRRTWITRRIGSPAGSLLVALRRGTDGCSHQSTSTSRAPCTAAPACRATAGASESTSIDASPFRGSQ
jgi:hypothetical protein